MARKQGSSLLRVWSLAITVCLMRVPPSRAGDEGGRTMLAPCSPGYFPCNKSDICVEQRYQCDGIGDCPDESDEKDCEDSHKHQYWNDLFRKRPDEDREKKATSNCFMTKSPAECSCSSFSLYCEHRALDYVPSSLPRETQDLDLSGNSLASICPGNFSQSMPALKQLILTSTEIQSIASNTFQSMKNLRSLYLQSNELTTLNKDTFANNGKLRLLVLSNNPITRLEVGCFKDLISLVELDLRHCQIEELFPGVFDPLVNLKKLLVDGNLLQEIPSRLFAQLANLETLSLTKNVIHTISTSSFLGMGGLHSLSLSVNNLTRLANESFDNLRQLLKLDIRSNKLRSIDLDAFKGLSKIESLDLRDNPLRKLPLTLFDELTSLTHIYFDEFRLCSYALHVRVCEPRGDGISSFAHLLDNVVLRISVWIVAFLACCGNIFVLIGRMFMQEMNEVHSFFIKNLALADLLMGVYLFIIAYYDVSFRGEYIRHEESWRHSWQCNLSGSLSTLSSEASVFILTVITVDRYLSVSYPFSLKKRTRTFAVGCMVFVWSLAIFLAVLPLLDTETFGDEFYGNNGVCLALQIHEPYSAAWEYSAFLFCGLNLAAFVFVTYAYANMSLTIASSQAGLRSHQQQQDKNIAQRFAFIVATDCLCWVPIVIIKILALAGVPINDDLYAWVAVFLLPVNSALNPILYTLTTKLFKEHLIKIMGTHSRSRNGGSPTTLREHSGTSLSTIINLSRGSYRSSRPVFVSLADTINSRSNNNTRPTSLSSDAALRDRDSYCLQRFLSTDTQNSEISEKPE